MTSDKVLALQHQPVADGGGADDGGAVLIVMEDRNLHALAQLLLDDEAFGRLDVFQIDAAEGRLQRRHDLARSGPYRVASTSRSKTSMPANFLNRTALPSITGLEARGPISPRPSTAVPLVITATRLPRAVYSRASDGIGRDGLARRGHARRIGQRQVALVGHALGGFDRQFAGPGKR